MVAEATTPGRKTVLVFDEWLPVVQQPAFDMHREAEVLASDNPSGQEGVRYLPGIGWQLKSKGWDPSDVVEADFGPSLVMPGTAASAYEQHDRFKPAGFGSTPSGVASSGFSMWSKFVPSSASTLSSTLSSDVSAVGHLPSSNSSGAARYPSDRAWVSDNVHLPDQKINVHFYVPMGASRASDEVLSFCFSGPASNIPSETNKGTGYYGVALAMDGTARLWEWSTAGEWVYRWRFTYSDQPVNGGHLFLGVVSDAIDDGDGNYIGSKICFRTVFFAGDGFIPVLVATATAAIKNAHPRLWPTYKVPGGMSGTAVPQKARIDVREDIFASFLVSLHAYPTSGTLVDAPFSTPLPAQGSEPMYAYVFAHVPTTNTLSAVVTDLDTGATVTLATDYAGPLGLTVHWTPTAGSQHWRIAVTDTGDGTRTSTVKAQRYHRAPVTATPSVTPFEVVWHDQDLPNASLESVEIADQQRDPATSSMVLTVKAYDGYLDWLKDRAEVPVTLYDEADDASRTCTYKGYLEGVEWVTTSYGDGDQSGQLDVFTLHVLGEWARGYKMLVPQRYTRWDNDTGQPRKVTDVGVDMLDDAGYAGLHAIDSLDVRYWGAISEDGCIEPGERCLQVAQEDFQDYLGGYLIWDTSIGAMPGKWRLLRPKRPTLAVLACFDMNHPGPMKLPHWMDGDTIAVGGRNVPRVPVLEGGSYGQMSNKTEPPECGLITVVGAGDGVTSGRFSRTLVNVNCFDPTGSSPVAMSIDTLCGAFEVRIVDSMLPTQEAVDWLALRGYESLCCGRKIKSFIAPLVKITDPDDALQLRERNLRFYDLVGLKDQNGDVTVWIVARCDPIWGSDRFQKARYTLVQTSFMSSVVASLGRASRRDGFRRIANRATGKDARSPSSSVVQTASWLNHSQIVSLAANQASPMQDLTPGSLTYGEITYPSGYLAV